MRKPPTRQSQEDEMAELNDRSEIERDVARAHDLETKDGQRFNQAEVKEAEAMTLTEMQPLIENAPSGPKPTDQQRSRWGAASKANQIAEKKHSRES